MTDPLLDDVKALLDKDFGDDRILKQICRACENNEIISNYERNYVRKLAEKHLGRRAEITSQKPIEEKLTVPDIPIPSSIPIQQTQSYQHPDPPQTSSSNLKNSKLILGIGGIALIVIIAVAVSFSGISNVIPTTVEIPSTNFDSTTLSVQTDLSSYNNKDLISISGTSDTSGSINLSIENQSNQIIWIEQVSVKIDGTYSTLAIAGGQGWENSGIYIIKVDNDVQTKSSTFSFAT